MNFIRHLLQSSDASGSKSTILKPLTWLISILLGGLLLGKRIDAPEFVVFSLYVLLIVAVAIFFFTFLYCLFKNPDALRSEKFSIQKMAIERGIFGDDITGEHKEKLLASTRELEAGHGNATETSEDKEQ